MHGPDAPGDIFARQMRLRLHEMWHAGATRDAARAETERRYALILGDGARTLRGRLVLPPLIWCVMRKIWGPGLCPDGCTLPRPGCRS
jgi:hypothetical protein